MAAVRTLAQANPLATTLTDVYTATAPVATVTISSVVVCNRSAVATTFRFAVAVAGAADDPKQYLYYDLPILGNDTFIFTIGVTLAVTDKLRAYVGAATLSFNVFGVET